MDMEESKIGNIHGKLERVKEIGNNGPLKERVKSMTLAMIETAEEWILKKCRVWARGCCKRDAQKGR